MDGKRPGEIVLFVEGARRQAGVSRLALAKRAGVGDQVVDNWLCRGTSPTLSTLEPVLGALGYRLVVERIEK